MPKGCCDEDESRYRKVAGVSVTHYHVSDGSTWWKYVVDLPKAPGTTDRNQKVKRGFISHARAQQAGLDLLKKVRRVKHELGTVASEFDQWIEEIELRVKISTVGSLRSKFGLYILPYIGEMHITDAATPIETSKLYKKLATNGQKERLNSPNGGPLGEGTVFEVHSKLKQFFKERGLDVSDINPPGNRRKRQPAKRQRLRQSDGYVWTTAQAHHFIEHTRNHRFHLAFCLALTLGFRRGELAGLRWSDIDMDGGFISIDNQRTTIPGVPGVYETDPKYESNRDVPIGPKMREKIKAHREILDRERDNRPSRRKTYVESGYVFVKYSGGPYNPDSFRLAFRKAAASLGLPVIKLHNARKVAATTGLGRGVDVTSMQTIGGWATPKVMLDVYSQQNLDAVTASVTVLEDALL